MLGGLGGSGTVLCRGARWTPAASQQFGNTIQFSGPGCSWSLHRPEGAVRPGAALQSPAGSSEAESFKGEVGVILEASLSPQSLSSARTGTFSTSGGRDSADPSWLDQLVLKTVDHSKGHSEAASRPGLESAAQPKGPSPGRTGPAVQPGLGERAPCRPRPGRPGRGQADGRGLGSAGAGCAGGRQGAAC